MKTVSSSANARYKTLRRLVDSSQERNRSGLSVLDGTHLVAAYLQHVGPPEQVIVSRSGAENPEVRALLARTGNAETLMLGDALFKNLSSVVTPTGILALVRTPRAQAIPLDMDACVMLEDLQDPGNLGSILRSCSAAGVRHVLLSRGSVHAWSPRVLRAAMGAHFMLSIHEQAELAAAVRAFPGRVIATAQRASQTVFDADLKGSVAFLFGNEGAGLSATLLGAVHATVSIPMARKTESLNVAAAAAVCLFERVRQLKAQRRGP